MPFVGQRGRGVLVWLVAAMMVHAALAATPVSVQLVLAVDVSGSVSEDRFELQREGYAAAFRNPAVLQAIRSTSTGSIAVAMLQWTGPALHVVAADWTALTTQLRLNALPRRSSGRRARCSVAAPRSVGRSTMHGR
jgi:hypothetical protein